VKASYTNSFFRVFHVYSALGRRKRSLFVAGARRSKNALKIRVKLPPWPFAETILLRHEEGVEPDFTPLRVGGRRASQLLKDDQKFCGCIGRGLFRPNLSFVTVPVPLPVPAFLVKM
jgi:hypothetical protein